MMCMLWSWLRRGAKVISGPGPCMGDRGRRAHAGSGTGGATRRSVGAHPIGDERPGERHAGLARRVGLLWARGERVRARGEEVSAVGAVGREVRR